MDKLGNPATIDMACENHDYCIKIIFMCFTDYLSTDDNKYFCFTISWMMFRLGKPCLFIQYKIKT